MNYPKISIVFPTYNGWQDTKECLRSILRLRYPLEKIEVIVVDNGSTDGSVQEVKNLKLKIENSSKIKNLKLKIIENDKNLGFSRAVNLGIKGSCGEFLLITNNDVIFEKNYLIFLVEFLQKNPLVGMVGGKVFFKHPKKGISFAGAKFNFYTGNLKPGKNPNQASPSDWVPGCNLLVKRKVLEQIGPFDEQFFFYFEDLDLCLRAKKAGYQVICNPKAIMYHGEGISIDKEGWQKKSEYYYQGKLRILFKHGTILQQLFSLSFQFFLGLPYQFLVLKHQNYTSAIKALAQNIKIGPRNTMI